MFQLLGIGLAIAEEPIAGHHAAAIHREREGQVRQFLIGHTLLVKTPQPAVDEVIEHIAEELPERSGGHIQQGVPVQNTVLLDEEAYEADVAARAITGIGVRPLDEILDADPADEPFFVLEVVVERLSRDMGPFA